VRILACPRYIAAMLPLAAETFLGFRNELVVGAVLGGLFILAAISAFAAQRWAHRCFVELKAIRQTLQSQKDSGQIATPPKQPGSYLDE